MFAGISFDNTFLLLALVGGFWFTARFVIGPKRGAPGLKSLFGKVKPVEVQGLGRDAIATLLEETRKFVVATPDLRGLMLAGPFAGGTADSRSTVTLVFLADEIGRYAGPEWVTRWGYPARGHAITDHRIETDGAGTLHRLTLRGAPPLEVHIVRVGQPEMPPALRPALAKGARSIDDPAGLTEKLRLHWVEMLRTPPPGA